MPEQPEQRASFLSFPQTREHVIHRHVALGMLPHVLILEPVHDEHRQKRDENSEYCESVREIQTARSDLPARIERFIVGAENICYNRENRGHKSEDNKKMSQLSP